MIAALFALKQWKGPASQPVRYVPRPVTSGLGWEADVNWSPESEFIAFGQVRNGGFDVMVQPVAGGPAATVLRHCPAALAPIARQPPARLSGTGGDRSSTGNRALASTRLGRRPGHGAERVHVERSPGTRRGRGPRRPRLAYRENPR